MQYIIQMNSELYSQWNSMKQHDYHLALIGGHILHDNMNLSKETLNHWYQSVKEGLEELDLSEDVINQFTELINQTTDWIKECNRK